MKITFLGTGAAEGFPAVFCSCKNCSAVRFNKEEYRTRSQVLIDGELSVDFPPEAYVHSLRFGVDLSALKYLFVTHSHMDHFYAHDFILRGYKYAKLESGVLNVYGNAEVVKVFGECTSREMKEDVAGNLKVNEIHAFGELKAGDYRILVLPAVHSAKEEALLFYIERGGKGYLHLYDTGALSEEAVDFLAEKGAKAQAVALDCTFLDSPHRDGTRHMCLEDCLSVRSRLLERGVADGESKFIMTHFSHNSNPVSGRVKSLGEQYGMIPAYDGFTVEI